MLTFEDISCFIPSMSEACKELLGDLLKAMSRVLPVRIVRPGQER
jgi:hypothetical protein